MMSGYINIDIKNNNLIFSGESVAFKKKYGLNIRQILFSEDRLYVLGIPDSLSDFDDGFNELNVNNVFLFDSQGNLIWNRGSYLLKLESGKEIDVPPSYMEIDDKYIKLYYQSDHEIWLDQKTGDKIREEFVFKK